MTRNLYLALLLLTPTLAPAQGFGAREDGYQLSGASLTYYPAPDFAKCQNDCANNGNCRGFTWIQAGTYQPRDPAMCYLMSNVTGRSPARGHYSAVKATRPTGGTTGVVPVTAGNGFTAEDNSNRPGADYRSFEVPQGSYATCRDACAGDGNCRSYTYVKPGIQGTNARCYMKSEIPAARADSCCISGYNGSRGITGTGGLSAEDNTNRYGSDYRNFALPQPNFALCRDACASDPKCQAYTYVKPGVQGSTAGCYLKSSVPPARPEPCCISGAKAGGTTTTGGTSGGTTGGTTGGVTITAAMLAGTWQFSQCDGQYGLLIGITANGQLTFGGGFENGNGQIQNGRINGNQISFNRVIYQGQEQLHVGQVQNINGRLSMSGTWTGYKQEVCNGRNNWKADKR